MSKRLYVGNLSYSTSEAQLESAFAAYGVSSVIIPTGPDGRSKGFAFLEVDAEQMGAAISAMHGQEMGGRTLAVNEARPRQERGSGGGRW